MTLLADVDQYPNHFVFRAAMLVLTTANFGLLLFLHLRGRIQDLVKSRKNENCSDQISRIRELTHNTKQPPTEN